MAGAAALPSPPSARRNGSAASKRPKKADATRRSPSKPQKEGKKAPAKAGHPTPSSKKRGDPKPPKEGKKAPGRAGEKPTTSSKKREELKPPKKGKKAPGRDGENPTPSSKKRGEPKPLKEAKRKKKASGEGETPTKKRKEAAAADPAACSFPMSRVRRLVRSEDAGIRASNDAVFLINKSSELFLERFVDDGYRNALKEYKKSISYDNLSTAVCNQNRYKFLSDFVPQKVAAEDALKAMAMAQ